MLKRNNPVFIKINIYLEFESYTMQGHVTMRQFCFDESYKEWHLFSYWH